MSSSGVRFALERGPATDRENAVLTKLINTHLTRPVKRFGRSGIQVKYGDLDHQAGSWNKPRRVVAKIEWRFGELFPRYCFMVTNSRLPADKVVNVYHGREDVKNRIIEKPCNTRMGGVFLKKQKKMIQAGFGA